VPGPAEQLPLEIGGEPRRLPARIVPMQPTPVAEPFDDPAYLFEPAWPGVRCLAFVERGELRLQAEGLADALRAAPELTALPGQLRFDGVVLDGMLLVLDADGRPDAALLRRRLGGGGDAHAARRAGRAAFVASDLLWSEGQPLTRRPFRARRQRLEETLMDGAGVAVAHAYPSDGRLVAEALRELGVEQLFARRLDARYRAGRAGDAWLRAPVVSSEPVEVPRPALALIQKLPLEH
jgi:ATP-dependent DNA ligase